MSKRTICLLLLLSALALACSDAESSPPSDIAVADTSSSDTNSSDTNLADTNLADTATGSDAASTADSGCQSFGTLGDGKFGGDKCWAPPANYCSAGATQAFVRGCQGDGQLCCTFATGCIPCGWTNCFEYADGAGCDQAAPSENPPACGPFMPHQQPICLD